MDADSNEDNARMASTSTVLSVFCFTVTACYTLKLFKPSQDAPMPGHSPGQAHMGRQLILWTSGVSGDEQSENVGTERESSEEETYEVSHNERKEIFDVEEGKTDDLFFSESEESGLRDLLEEERELSRERSIILIADNNATSPAPSKKQGTTKAPRKPSQRLRAFGDDHYRPYDARTQNQGAPVMGPFRHFGQFDGCALYINPNLKDTELDQIPHSGVRVDDLTASKVLSHYGPKILHARWLAEFDLKGMIRATRVPLGRAAKRWVNRGERDVDGMLVWREGWYYLSWGGIHTLMGKEGLDADRYWIRPSFESFKCPGLGFKRSDWAEVQLAPEDPADPTFL